MRATGFAIRPILGQPLRLDGDASTAAGVLARHIGWVMAVGLTPVPTVARSLLVGVYPVDTTPSVS